MRICDFPLMYTDKEGKDKVVNVDTTDYVRYKSGEKTIKEAFGHYVDEEIIKDLEEYEKTHQVNNL